jgi:hypothetical protein
MSYVKAAQVVGLLTKKGLPKGTKAKNAKMAIDGVVAYQADDGWVQVVYNNLALAEQDGIDLYRHNDQARQLIHFILCDMNEYEFKYNNYDTEGHFARHEYFYRKATN